MVYDCFISIAVGRLESTWCDHNRLYLPHQTPPVLESNAVGVVDVVVVFLYL